MRKRQGQRGFGGKACNRRIQRGDGASRGDSGGATRFGELTTITRPRDTLPHARSGPTSLTLAGRPGSLRGQRGKKERETSPRQQQIQLAGHDSEKEATKTEGGWTQPISDTRSRTGCPLTTAASLRQHVDRKGPAHFCLLRPGSAHSGGGRGSHSWMADFTEQKGNT